MLKFSTVTVVILFVTNLLSAASPLELFVAANGDDLNSGKSVHTAFATIERSRQEISKIKAAGELPADGIDWAPLN